LRFSPLFSTLASKDFQLSNENIRLKRSEERNTLLYRASIHPDVLQQFPQYSGLLLYAENLTNGPSDEYSTALLRQVEQKLRERLSLEDLPKLPHIQAWREAYRRFGSNPKKFPSSLEALLKRVLKGNELPAINRVVDIYNAMSLEYLLPVGGEDWTKLASDLALTTATGTEPFVVFHEGQETVTYPDKGEIIWADAEGVTCRRWNWRQCKRTQLTEATLHAYFVLDSLAPYTKDQLQAAGETLASHLRHVTPDCTISMEVLGALA
jgi:DNA/RNA-binding domain of Phe-tRNA-synthetase-like protein